MGDFHTPFSQGSEMPHAIPGKSLSPNVPISHPGGEKLSSPFVDGNQGSGAAGGVSIPQGENIAGPTPGPLASPFQEGALKGKNS